VNTVKLAIRAGKIDGENQARGAQVAIPDLLIAVTALELGYSVRTANLRDFRRVRGLTVVQLWLETPTNPIRRFLVQSVRMHER
jgi:predicted nucleic acid-binding protein